MGFWLGVLSPHGLDAVDELQYRTNAMYRGEEYNLSGLMPWEEDAIDRFFQGRHRLAVLAAGGGREVLALERRGHAVDGFECNVALVSFAKDFLPRHGAAASIGLLPRDTAPPLATYDGVILGWSAYMLINGRKRRVALLRRLHPLMPEGAPLMLSFFSLPAETTRLRTAFRIARAIRWVLRRDPPDFGDDLIPSFAHRFDEKGIAAELREAGFALARYAPQGPGKFDSGWAVAIRH